MWKWESRGQKKVEAESKCVIVTLYFDSHSGMLSLLHSGVHHHCPLVHSWHFPFLFSFLFLNPTLIFPSTFPIPSLHTLSCFYNQVNLISPNLFLYCIIPLTFTLKSLLNLCSKDSCFACTSKQCLTDTSTTRRGNSW